jgi:NAD(P) transhydrogenase subunit alpha
MSSDTNIVKQAQLVSDEAYKLSEKINQLIATQSNVGNSEIDPFIFALTIFILSCFIGYYVVWKVTPALHTPLMSVTNAISGIIIIGAMIAVGPEGFGFSQFLGLIAVIIASINIFGGFIVTNRMLEMFKKK